MFFALKRITTTEVFTLTKKVIREKTNEVSTPVSMYLRQIGEMRRLSKEEELELWMRFAECRGLKKKFVVNDDNKYEFEKLENEIYIIQNKLVKSNLRLVVSVAKKYYNSGIPFIDMIDEGNIGLIEAVRRFDYQKGFKFSTYAVWWVKERIIKAISSKKHVITLPVYVSRLIRTSLKVTKSLNQKLGREPSIDDIAAEMKIDVKTLSSIMFFSQEMSSIDGVFRDSENNEMFTFLEDKSYNVPYHNMLQDNLKSMINDVLSNLDEKERTVLISRFGLDGNDAKTLEETGKELDITRERVRQIQIKALRKIRELNLSEELKAFLWN